MTCPRVLLLCPGAGKMKLGCLIVRRTLPGSRCKLREAPMDVLSEVLKVVKLEGAVYFNGEFSAPWNFRSPASHRLAPYLAPGAGHVIIYHLLIEGRGHAETQDGLRVSLGPGDIVVFPHGDPHVIGNGVAREAFNSEKELQRILSQ